MICRLVYKHTSNLVGVPGEASGIDRTPGRSAPGGGPATNRIGDENR